MWKTEKLDINRELEVYFRRYILSGKNLAATMPAAPKVALPRRKLLQVPLIVRYLTKLVGASWGTFCEVQKLGGCCIGFRHWSKELPKFRRNGPINALSNEPSGLKKGRLWTLITLCVTGSNFSILTSNHRVFTCLKSTMETPEQIQSIQWLQSGVFVATFEYIIHIVLLFPLLSWNRREISKGFLSDNNLNKAFV